MKNLIKELIPIFIGIIFGVFIGLIVIYAYDKETVVDNLTIKEYINR